MTELLFLYHACQLILVVSNFSIILEFFYLFFLKWQNLSRRVSARCTKRLAVNRGKNYKEVPHIYGTPKHH